ncbi:Uncharacterised protein [Mycobacteroides abscessus subsp. abscessus]|nr:Uncharacterised protein [Mycobacteroides abscessus subsp. abscessus]
MWPSASRTCNVGSGLGAMGNWCVITRPSVVNDVVWQGHCSRSFAPSNQSFR